MDFWVKGKTEHGDWDMQVLVKEGDNKIVKGDMQIGRVAPEPIGFSDDVGPYASAFKSSIVWLSGFTTRLDPKALDAPAWGKIGSIGGMQVGPTGQKETVTIPAGTKAFSGSLLTAAYRWTFETPRPVIQRSTPGNGQNHVELDHPIVAVFNQPVDPQKIGTWISVEEKSKGVSSYPLFSVRRPTDE